MNIWKFIKNITNLICWLWLSLYAAFSVHALAFADNIEERVYVIEKAWVYRAINPLSGTSLGFTPPLIGVAFVNKEAAYEAKTSIDGVVRHEAKHIEQFWELGVKYYQTEEWKLEGVADYVRGESTADLCSPKVDESANRLRYRDNFILVKYLIEAQSMNESQVYDFNGYPIEAAKEWVLTKECGKA